MLATVSNVTLYIHGMYIHGMRKDGRRVRDAPAAPRTRTCADQRKR